MSRPSFIGERGGGGHRFLRGGRERDCPQVVGHRPGAVSQLPAVRRKRRMTDRGGTKIRHLDGFTDRFTALR